MTITDGVSLFQGYMDTSNQLVFGYVGILSAFLIMSYFAADKLSKWLMLLVLILFSTICALVVIQLNLTRTDMANLYEYLIEFDGPDSVWLGENPSWVPGALTVLFNFVTFGGYAGCMAFFFYQRTHRDSA